MFFYSYIGVNGKAQNGFSQPASATPPVGTWENGVFDYDHIKKSYIPTYTRYWDDASKVPFLYNASTGIWISYDDLQSIGLKNDYIKQEKLAGAMFWELSSDRNSELIGATFEALNNGMPPSSELNLVVVSVSSIIQANSTSSRIIDGLLSTKRPGSDVPAWNTQKAYTIGDRVTYADNIYQCLLAHTSLQGWTPLVTPALWKLA
jgi:hypothetical protein